MRPRAIFPAWNRILHGYRPFLSIEITKSCPLRCPGCYAYEPDHLNDGRGIRAQAEHRGNELIEAVLDLVKMQRPLHVSFVGGEPLLRRDELTPILRRLHPMGIEAQIVTSAVFPIPEEWAHCPNLHLVVSIDGLRAEHDIRRRPATYDCILRNIGGHPVAIHCTIVPDFLTQPDYLREFARFWSTRHNVHKIWFSLFTPQKGDRPPERLTPEQRALAIERIAALSREFPKVYAPAPVLSGYRHPPGTPARCIFAQITNCVSADLVTPVTPCQIGGQPECSECGCLAGAGMASIGEIRLAGLLKVSNIFTLSRKWGERRLAAQART